VIAREAGISQPYLFHLFRTKKELFRRLHALALRRRGRLAFPQARAARLIRRALALDHVVVRFGAEPRRGVLRTL
jgi:AcrR family transcriptional regulator